MLRHCRVPMLLAFGLLGCGTQVPVSAPAPSPRSGLEHRVDHRLTGYAPVRLTADLGALTPRERRMLPLLIRAAEIMDDLFWQQSWGDRAALDATIRDPATRRFLAVNYGPWDRLDDDRPFVVGIGAKPPGANFYPSDMTDAEFESFADPRKTGLYTLLRRDGTGGLRIVPYREAYARPLAQAAALLREAAELAEDAGLRRYLGLRAAALVSDDYRISDFAWLEMKSNRLDIVIGPIEVYEDKRYNHKAAYEAYVLVRDLAWSERLARHAALLPDLQQGLPVPEAYRREAPGAASDLNAYDVVFYAGQANAGAKTIAINLPNDEEVQLSSGTRRLQLKNAMRAKFDRILTPIAAQLIVPEQRAHVKFDAFFANVMFHEVAHGLGIRRTVNGRGYVRDALKETYSALEEGKADVLGLYLVTKLLGRGELAGTTLMDHYVTFIAGIARSVRFGAADAHGLANMMQFNSLLADGAIMRDESGRYRIDAGRMGAAIEKLASRILLVQGDGDLVAARRMLADEGMVPPLLASDIGRLAAAGIPVDIVFEQGAAVLGL